MSRVADTPDLHELSRRAEASAPARRLLARVALLAAPLLLGIAVDLGARAFVASEHELRMPWQAQKAPFLPLRDELRSEAWGDLLRMAHDPAWEREIEPVYPRTQHLVTDALGYFNAPRARDAPPPAVIVTGASFMTAGSSVSAGFAAQLSERLGVEVQNRAWPGHGPVYDLLELLGQPEPEAAQVIVLAIVARSLEARLFDPVLRELTPTGRERPRAAQLARVRELLRWPQKLEQFLEVTSLPRERSVALRRVWPPGAFELGHEGRVKLGRLAPDGLHKLLLFDDALRSASRSYAERDGDLIVAALQRVARALAARDQQLLVVLIPDTPQVYRKRLLSPALPDGEKGARALALLARRLADAGVPALDLLPRFERAADRWPPIYRADDTHWWDPGIALAADEVAACFKQHGPASCRVVLE